LNENKLKITLTNEDMASMDITFEEMDYDEDIGTKRVVWELLDAAKRQFGFYAAGSEKLYIKVHPAQNGGCFIYVTKDSQTQKTQPSSSSSSSYNTYEKKYRTKLYTGIKKKRFLYVFENSENLLCACIKLNETGYNGKSDIFADGRKYYLYIEENTEYALDLISEYGVLINNPYFCFCLDEHTKKILSSDAIKKFAGIFGHQ